MREPMLIFKNEKILEKVILQAIQIETQKEFLGDIILDLSPQSNYLICIVKNQILKKCTNKKLHQLELNQIENGLVTFEQLMQNN